MKMKFNTLVKSLGISILCLSAYFGVSAFTHESQDDIKVKTLVLHKIGGEYEYDIKGVSHNSRYFTLILKDLDSGVKFDLDVTPTTFCEAKKGDVLYFNLKRWQVDGNTHTFGFYLLGCVICLILGIIIVSLKKIN